MVISHNLLAMNSNRQLGITTKKQAKLTEKLSSGYRINRSADDAAGLAISEKMRRQVRGLTQASSNCQDGISLIQTAEGGLNEVHEMIQRLNELAIKAANGTLNPEDREYVDSEFQALKKEINRVADSTTFNEIQLFPSDGSSIYAANYDLHINADGTYTMSMNNDAYTVGTVTATDNAKTAATYIAGLIPGITSDIISKFPSLQGSADLDIKLDLSYIDGGNNTLAYASFSYYPASGGSPARPVLDSFMVKVDTADFTDSNTGAGQERDELLKATLRHELTHTVMQYNLTDAMVNLPSWFKEGSAQLTGGGFSTGWISGLANCVTDEDYSNYLKKYSVDSQPYGHGFIATAYAAYKAAGSPATFDGAALLGGLDRIFGRLKAGDSLDAALTATTGMNASQLKSKVNTGDADVVKFLKPYTEASKKGDGTFGSGSALLSSFADGSAILGAVPADGSAATQISAATNLFIQAGSEAGQQIDLNLFSIGTNSLGLSSTNVLTQDSASRAIDNIKGALSVVSSIRSYYGATQNRLEHTVKNLDNVIENTTAAESLIRDTDMAKAMVEYSNNNILAQAGTSMLAQANQASQNVLSLLQ